MKAHSEKLMNVSDMQLPDEDDRVAAQPPPYDQNGQQDRERANLNGRVAVSPANNKIAKERIWISPASKIVVQPMDTDTDAQLHKERVMSVRKAAELASRVVQFKKRGNCSPRACKRKTQE